VKANSVHAAAADEAVDDIIAALKQIIVGDLDVNLSVDQIDESAPLVEEGLGLDSVVLVQMIGIIEANLGCEFLDSDLRMRTFRNLRTLAEVVALRIRDRGGAD
jgi:acyl carrier protein